ncbi:L-type lectin-domain containing receptor kinase S.4-like [Phragmites australis]|uniref:L-type lectin-domain containing receptor kinase S.4-like n=1 Tax=Phragmites australis TaxID=29695 RepID=UPI002D79477D|nr:L-type lectin-domain containing receptor kinase S.4-like [Phragmites australis]
MSNHKPKLPILFFFLLLLFLLASLAASQEFTYKGFRAGAAGGNPNLTLNGVTEPQPHGILRLTNETSRLIGHAFYPSPLRLVDRNGTAVSFSTQFAFAVVPEYPKLGGHGFAFVAAPDPRLRGALPSQYLGLLSAADVGNATNHVFAVEFDTVQDFEFGDINDNHVGVDLNSLVSNASASAAPVNLKSGDTVLAWVDYDGAARRLNVSIATGSSEKPAAPLISFRVDLSAVFREQMYVGFSASTGLLASSHYLMGWSFRLGGGAAPKLDLSSLPSLPRPKDGKNRTSLILAAAFSAFVALVLLAGAGAYAAYRYKNRDVIEPWELDYGPHRFKYAELRRATRGFRERELLGSGGFGKVYRGVLPGSGETVAVKRVSHESRQGLREFVAEIASIGRLRHRNLVQLQGWCRRRGDLLLVYDYMPNGSLDRHLFGGDHLKASRLTWPARHRILCDVASALLYLHEGWEHVVLHRDVKASNVLLDADMSARLGDFGLAKLHERGTNPSTTRVVGTLGYLAPELTRTGKATAAADVFAFGALVLEVVAGRRPIEPRAPPEELVLAEWAWERYVAGEVDKVLDERLGGAYDAAEVAATVKVGLWCSHPSPAARPTMREVARYLEGGEAGEVPEPPPPPPHPPAYSGEVGFDDFVHSYPSSSFERAAAAGAGWDGGTQTSVATFPYSPLSMRSCHVSV